MLILLPTSILAPPLLLIVLRNYVKSSNSFPLHSKISLLPFIFIILVSHLFKTNLFPHPGISDVTIGTHHEHSLDLSAHQSVPHPTSLLFRVVLLITSSITIKKMTGDNNHSYLSSTFTAKVFFKSSSGSTCHLFSPCDYLIIKVIYNINFSGKPYCLIIVYIVFLFTLSIAFAQSIKPYIH